MHNEVNPKERIELIEVICANISAAEFSLGSLPNLRTASKIIRVEALPVSQVTISPSGKAVVNNGVFQKSFLKLISADNVEFRALALPSISKSINGTVIPAINTPRIDPEKSKIVVGTAAGLVLNEVWLLSVTYEKES